MESNNIFHSAPIVIRDENDPFFDLVDRLRSSITSLNPTPLVVQALMRLADMEEILLAQGWVKIDPLFGERYNPELHQVNAHANIPGLPPGHIVEVIKPGYRCQQLSYGLTKPQIRPAVVDLST